VALEEWYTQVRLDFFRKQELGEWILQGALEKLAMAKEERLQRLRALAAKMPDSMKKDKPDSAMTVRKKEFHERITALCELVMEKSAPSKTMELKEAFLIAFQAHGTSSDRGYIETIKSLPHHTAKMGTEWLQQIVEDLCEQTVALLPALKLFRK